MMTLFTLGYCIGLFGAIIVLAKKYCDVVDKLHELEETVESARSFNWELSRMYIDLRKELQDGEIQRERYKQTSQQP